MMRIVTLGALVSLLNLGCTVSPVISADPDANSGRSGLYHDCRRAARDYCRFVTEVAKDEEKACIAQSTYECVSGRK